MPGSMLMSMFFASTSALPAATHGPAWLLRPKPCPVRCSRYSPSPSARRKPLAASSISAQAAPGRTSANARRRAVDVRRGRGVVRSRVSAELQRGPRGGGRDREHIVRHVVANELAWGKGLGVPAHEDALLTDEGLKAHRDAYCDGIRAYHAQGKPASKWPLRYLIRHTAFHTLDHAWEMQDRDLTGRQS